MQKWSGAAFKAGKSIGVVPTMGALHEAHGSLIKRARQENDLVITTVFVNPAQFGPGEDYEAYPRDFNSDREFCEKEKVDAIFHPSTDEMYANPQTVVKIGKLASTMCGAFRPGHFDGVATVVAKLFNITKSTRAYFGLKDYQQLRIIKQLAVDLNFDLEIIGCPIIRESDGLAFSSRNRYLSEDERRRAVYLNKALKHGWQLYRKGEKKAGKIAIEIRDIISENTGGKIDYAGVYDADSLEEISGDIKENIVIAAAVHIGKTRLIDNVSSYEEALSQKK